MSHTALKPPRSLRDARATLCLCFFDGKHFPASQWVQTGPCFLVHLPLPCESGSSWASGRNCFPRGRNQPSHQGGVPEREQRGRDSLRCPNRPLCGPCVQTAVLGHHPVVPRTPGSPLFLDILVTRPRATSPLWGQSPSQPQGPPPPSSNVFFRFFQKKTLRPPASDPHTCWAEKLRPPLPSRPPVIPQEP